MSLETECEINLRKGGQVVIDRRRAQFLVKIGETGSIDRAIEALGISVAEAKAWIDDMDGAYDVAVISYGPQGEVSLTDGGKALLSDYDTRSRMAKAQVQNLWKKPWVTADGIVIIEDQVVLIKRGREPFKGMYALPGGIVEYGETLEECAIREIEEETGLKTKVLDLVGVYSAADRDPRGHFVTLAFNLQPVGGSLKGGDDADDARLFSLDHLPEMAADHREILSDALRKRGKRLPDSCNGVR